MVTSRKAQPYTAEEKASATARAEKDGCGPVSRELGIPPGTLSCWVFEVRQARHDAERGHRCTGADADADGTAHVTVLAVGGVGGAATRLAADPVRDRAPLRERGPNPLQPSGPRITTP